MDAGINEYQKPCERTPRGICPRQNLCDHCSNLEARRKAAELYRRLRMLEEIEGIGQWGMLTVTLPGRGHPIRHASLVRQYEWMTWNRRSKYTMRGLHEELKGRGALGGITFLEIKYNQEESWWHLHAHILVGSTETSALLDIPHSRRENYCLECFGPMDCECPDEVFRFGERILGRNWNRLGTLGFGRRISWDPYVDERSGIEYCTKAAYATKPIQYSRGDDLDVAVIQELKWFFWKHRPRMVRVWGAARIPKHDRESWETLETDRQRL